MVYGSVTGSLHPEEMMMTSTIRSLLLGAALALGAPLALGLPAVAEATTVS